MILQRSSFNLFQDFTREVQQSSIELGHQWWEGLSLLTQADVYIVPQKLIPLACYVVCTQPLLQVLNSHLI